MASYKSALQSIAVIQVSDATDYKQLAMLCIGLAVSALASNDKTEMAKQSKDLRLAESASVVLRRHLSRTEHDSWSSVPVEVEREAISNELYRLDRAIMAGPEALKAIYRRKECRS